MTRGALLGFLVLLALAAAPSRTADAQATGGSIAGTVLMGTAGEPLAAGTVVQLIVLDGTGVRESRTAEVSDGRYAFEVEPTPALTYVLYVRYEGVDYFAEPVLLSAEERSAERALTVYATTDQAPSLRVAVTVMTLIGIDRAGGEIDLLREDLVTVDGDRVFVGDASGVTLRLTAPEGAVEAALGDGTSLDLEGGVVAVREPVRPGVLTQIVTHYVVRYDPAADRYRLRVTAPAPTGHIEARVPEDYVRRLQPRDDARLGEPVTLEAPAGPAVLRVALIDGPVEPGRGLIVDLEGLAAAYRTHPLTEQPGAAVAALAGVVVLGGGIALAARARRRAA